MKIRTATTNDLSQLTHLKNPETERDVKLIQELHLRRLDELKNEEILYLVAEEGNQIIAHVLFKINGIPTELGYPNMSDLYVVDEKRNLGIGTALVQEGEKIAEEKGYTKISLAVNPSLNPNAMSLYKRLGYKQTTTDSYVDGVYDGNEDWVIDMVKVLSSK